MEKRKQISAEKTSIHKGPIGISSVADQERIVCIPDNIRMRHTHLIGRSIGSKTTLIERMTMDDIKNGHGVAVIDPHGDLVEKLLNACSTGSQDNRAVK